MAKTERGEAMSVDDRLPSEIWYQILTKIPAKSILRCRSVCRTWYSLISSPDFITDHAAQTLNHSTTNRVLVHRRDLYKHDDEYELSLFSFHDESFVESHEDDDLLEQLRSRHVRIVGSCNGLVCLLIKVERTEEIDDIEGHRFLIWNPSIRKSIELPFRPLPPHRDNGDVIHYLLGFGFDSNSGAYKVLRAGYFITGNQFGVPVVSEIFDLKKGVWRGISPPMPPTNIQYPDSCVYLHGSLHWIEYENWHSFVLVSFNLSSEVSQKMGMPDGIGFKHYYYHSVLVNNGSLSMALLTTQLKGDYVQNYCTVWSMKEYGVTESWTKLFNIELPDGLNDSGLVRFLENGVVIAGRHGDNALVVYNLRNRTSKALLLADQYVFDVCFYKESLVLL